MSGTLVSVNVGRPREVQAGRKLVETAIWKEPVKGRVAVRGVNVAGDDQADRSVHGGPDKAIYAYASEDTAWWMAETGKELGPGAFGENLTTKGVEVTHALLGERWAVGSTLLEVRQPRIPCFKLGLRMGDPRFVKSFAEATRPGAYLAIVEEGEVAAGDTVEVVHRPTHTVSVELLFRAYLQDHSLLPAVLAVPDLVPSWRSWIEGQLA